MRSPSSPSLTRLLAVWPTEVPPSTVANGTQVFMPPGVAADELLARPFHIYDDAFHPVIGQSPTLTLIAQQATDPLYHEAVVWFVPFPSRRAWRGLAQAIGGGREY